MKRWIARTVAGLSLLGLFYACPGVSWADNISQINGIAAKDTSSSLTWRHVLAIPSNIFGTGAFATSASRYLSGSYSVVAGCTGINCTSLAAASVLAPNGDGFLSGNQSLMTIAHLYVSDPATGPPFNWNRLRSGLANTDPNGYLNVILRSRTGQTWQSDGIADNQNPTITNGWFNTLRFGVGVGGNVFKVVNNGFLSGGAEQNICDNCQAVVPWVATGVVDAGSGRNVSSPWTGEAIQGRTLFNSQTTGAADTAVVVTITGVAGERGHLFSVDARCSAGTSGLTVADAATTRWSTAATQVSTTNFVKQWNPALTMTTANNLVITLATCGAGNTGTLMVQADQY